MIESIFWSVSLQTTKQRNVNERSLVTDYVNKHIAQEMFENLNVNRH